MKNFTKLLGVIVFLMLLCTACFDKNGAQSNTAANNPIKTAAGQEPSISEYYGTWEGGDDEAFIVMIDKDYFHLANNEIGNGFHIANPTWASAQNPLYDFDYYPENTRNFRTGLMISGELTYIDYDYVSAFFIGINRNGQMVVMWGHYSEYLDEIVYDYGVFKKTSNKIAKIPAPFPYHENYNTPYGIDFDLVGGRWVANNGNRIELFADGSGVTNLNLWELPFGYENNNKNIIWEAENNRLYIAVVLVRENHITFHYNESIGDYDYLTARYVNERYRRESKTTGIYGLWMPMNSGGGGIQINEDGTGEDQITRYGNFTWTEENGVMTQTFVATRRLDYIVNGSTLTLYGNTSSVVFTRIGGN
jgi:hypothetical protein